MLPGAVCFLSSHHGLPQRQNLPSLLFLPACHSPTLPQVCRNTIDSGFIWHVSPPSQLVSSTPHPAHPLNNKRCSAASTAAPPPPRAPTIHTNPTRATRRRGPRTACIAPASIPTPVQISPPTTARARAATGILSLRLRGRDCRGVCARRGRMVSYEGVMMGM